MAIVKNKLFYVTDLFFELWNHYSTSKFKNRILIYDFTQAFTNMLFLELFNPTEWPNTNCLCLTILWGWCLMVWGLYYNLFISNNIIITNKSYSFWRNSLLGEKQVNYLPKSFFWLPCLNSLMRSILFLVFCRSDIHLFLGFWNVFSSFLLFGKQSLNLHQIIIVLEIPALRNGAWLAWKCLLSLDAYPFRTSQQIKQEAYLFH